MKKNIVIVGLCLAALFLLSRSFGLSDKYKLARDDYNELKKITEADKELSLALVAELTNAIGQADKTIVKLNGDIKVKNDRITLLSGQLADIVGQEPPTTPEIEAMPIVVSLRAQVKTLTDLYGISIDIITEKDKVIDLWSKKFDAEVTIAGEWKVQYEQEHRLRLLSEGLVTSLEHRVKAQGLLGKVKTVALGVAAGYVAYTIFKNK